MSAADGAARSSGRNFRIAETCAHASELPVVAAVAVAGLQAPACAVQPVAVTRTACGSPTSVNDTVKLGNTAVPRPATASVPSAGTLGQLQVRAVPLTLQPGKVFVADATFELAPVWMYLVR